MIEHYLPVIWCVDSCHFIYVAMLFRIWQNTFLLTRGWPRRNKQLTSMNEFNWFSPLIRDLMLNLRFSFVRRTHSPQWGKEWLNVVKSKRRSWHFRARTLTTAIVQFCPWNKINIRKTIVIHVHVDIVTNTRVKSDSADIEGRISRVREDIQWTTKDCVNERAGAHFLTK